MPHPSEYSNGGRPTLADVRSGAATYRDYIARLGEEQPPAAEPSTPATSSLIVAKSSSDVTRVRKNPRSSRFAEDPTALRAKVEADEQKRATDFERRRRIAREEVAAERRPADAARKAKLRERLMTSTQLDTVPDLEPLIDGWLFKSTLSQIFGPSGNYKTFVAADIARAICTGAEWHGHASKPGRVLYVVGEGVQGFRKRLRAIEAAKNLGRLDNLTVVNGAVQIGGPEWSEFVEVVAEDGYDLVIVDTLARTTVGRKENDNSDMGEVVAALDWLIEATGVGVLLVHHSGKGDSDDGRGASAIKAALQTQIRVIKRKGMTVEVKQTKQKDHDEIGPYYLQLEPFGDSLIVSSDRVVDGMAPDRAEEREQGKRELGRRLDANELAAMDHAQAICRVMAATYGGGMGATKAEVKRTYTELLKDTERPVKHSSFEKAWAKIENDGHLLRNPDEKRFVLGADGCKAIGHPFERPAFVSEDEWEEQGGDSSDIE